MSNKVKDIDIKNRRYYLFNDIISIENSDANNGWKVIQKYSYLLYWLCYNKRFEIRKNL